MWVLSTMMIPFSVIIIPLFFIIKSLGLVNSLWGMILPMVPHAYGVFLLDNTLWKCRILCRSQPESMDVRYFRL